MQTALVLCIADPAGNPRPHRMIRCLARDFRVFVISTGKSSIPNASCEPLPRPPRTIISRCTKILNLALRRYEPLIWTDGLKALADRHRALDHAVITVHELVLLPIALAMRGSGRVIFDAREYYPRHFENFWWWRALYGPLNNNLCRHYLYRADHVVTVSPGLADAYLQNFGVRCHLLPSMPEPRDLSPSPVNPTRIRMIHHGLASPARRLECMIELMDRLPEHFSLDLMLMPGSTSYIEKLKTHCQSRPRVRILPPAPFDNMIVFLATYDIGLFLVPPSNFNLRHTLPNKFFEFVQARLMIAIGPSPDMAAYVNEHDLGVVASDFQPATLAAALAHLGPEDIARFKHNSHLAAARLNTRLTNHIVRSLLPAETVPSAATLPSSTTEP